MYSRNRNGKKSYGRKTILQLGGESSKKHQQSTGNQNALGLIGAYDDDDTEDSPPPKQQPNPTNGVKKKEGDKIDTELANFLAEIDAIDEPPSSSSQDPETTTTESVIPVMPTTDWQQCLDEGTECYYFWNVATNEVTWEIPEDYSHYLLKYKEYEEKMFAAQKNPEESTSAEGTVDPSNASMPEQTTQPVDNPAEETDVYSDYGPATPASSHPESRGETVQQTGEQTDSRVKSAWQPETYNPVPYKDPISLDHNRWRLGFGSVDGSTRFVEAEPEPDPGETTAGIGESEFLWFHRDQHASKIKKRDEPTTQHRKPSSSYNLKFVKGASLDEEKARFSQNVDETAIAQQQQIDRDELLRRIRSGTAINSSKDFARMATKKDKPFVGPALPFGPALPERRADEAVAPVIGPAVNPIGPALPHQPEVEPVSNDDKQPLVDPPHQPRISLVSYMDESKEDEDEDEGGDDKNDDNDGDDDDKGQQQQQYPDDGGSKETMDATNNDDMCKKSKRGLSDDADQTEEIESKKIKTENAEETTEECVSTSDVKDESEEVNDEEVKQIIQDLSSVITSKLEFLDISRKNMSKLQILFIELQTRMSDWMDGGLSMSHLLKKLHDADTQIKLYEDGAAPSGWTCHWDRDYKRYFYMNETTGESQWEYPITADHQQQQQHTDGNVIQDGAETSTTNTTMNNEENRVDSSLMETGIDSTVMTAVEQPPLPDETVVSSSSPPPPPDDYPCPPPEPPLPEPSPNAPQPPLPTSEVEPPPPLPYTPPPPPPEPQSFMQQSYSSTPYSAASTPYSAASTMSEMMAMMPLPPVPPIPPMPVPPSLPPLPMFMSSQPQFMPPPPPPASNDPPPPGTEDYSTIVPDMSTDMDIDSDNEVDSTVPDSTHIGHISYGHNYNMAYDASMMYTDHQQVYHQTHSSVYCAPSSSSKSAHLSAAPVIFKQAQNVITQLQQQQQQQQQQVQSRESTPDIITTETTSEQTDIATTKPTAPDSTAAVATTSTVAAAAAAVPTSTKKKKKDKSKIKTAGGLSMKKKNVTSLVMKWQQAQQQVEKEISKRTQHLENRDKT
ncbi:uncharacterized protein LOC141912557 [Tubulanus polymorphus]|uniref:uncharacterized protein LOC141912557 n=1 Tax=Tubulanus polymorphus TaxID=672921 RepID=UPI003DA6B02C